MILDRLLNHLKESMNVDGDIIEFGIQNGETFKHLVKAAYNNDRKAYGIDSFTGLGVPSAYDVGWTPISTKQGDFSSNIATTEQHIKHYMGSLEADYEIIQGVVPTMLNVLPENNTYAFAFIDLIQYIPSKEALNYIWERMTYGSTIYLDSFYPDNNKMCSRAISEFIREHDDEIIVSRQMLINGKREQQIAIKCIRQGARTVSDIKGTNRELKVALVLKTGGDYTYQHVNNLARSIKEHLTLSHEVVLLTNDVSGVNMDYIDKVELFKHDFPKWWGKIELFRDELFNGAQVLYFDLDTFIIDNIDDIGAYRGNFSGLRDFYHLHSMGSGVMGWNSTLMTHVYRNFMPRANSIITGYPTGDQTWIDEQKKSIEFMQDLFPSKIVSYKAHCIRHGQEASVPEHASVICFHGPPRPHTVQDSNIKKYWNP